MSFSVTERLLVVLLAGLAAGGWLGLIAAQAGRWSPFAVTAAAFLVAGLVAWQTRPWRTRVEASWPPSSPDGDGDALGPDGGALADSTPPSGRLNVTLWNIAPVLLALLLVARLLPASTPWPTYLDASWYANTAARIVRDGSLVFRPAPLSGDAAQRRPLVATFGDHARAGVPRVPEDESHGFYDVIYATGGISDAAPGTVAPFHPPFFAAFLALAAHWRGVSRLGDGVLPWTFAYLLAAAALAEATARRLVKVQRTIASDARTHPTKTSTTALLGHPATPPVLAALAALLVLGLGPGLGYYGRQPFAEMAAGACLLAALWAGVRLAEQAGAAPGWAACYGLGLGLAALIKIDALPAAAVGLAWWMMFRRSVGGRLEIAALAAGCGLPLAHLAWLAATVSRPYFLLNGGGVLRLVGEHAAELGLGGLLVFLALVLVAARQRQRRGRGASRGRRGTLSALRVRVSAPRSQGDSQSGQVLARGTEGLNASAGRDGFSALCRLGAAGLALGFVAVLIRAALRPAGADPGMADILLWLSSPLGVAAALIGLWVVGEDSAAGAAASPLLLQALVSLPAVLAAPLVSESLSSLYAARRLMPLALPLVAVGAAVGGTLVVGMARRETASYIRTGALAGLALTLLALVRASNPLLGLREFEGGARMAQKLAGYGGPSDTWLFGSPLAGASVGRLAAPLWSFAGREAAALGPPAVSGEALMATVRALAKPGRKVFFVTDDLRVPEGLPDGTLRFLGEESIVTTVVLPSPGLPPRLGPLEIQAVVYALAGGP